MYYITKLSNSIGIFLLNVSLSCGVTISSTKRILHFLYRGIVKHLHSRGRLHCLWWSIVIFATIMYFNFFVAIFVLLTESASLVSCCVIQILPVVRLLLHDQYVNYAPLLPAHVKWARNWNQIILISMEAIIKYLCLLIA